MSTSREIREILKEIEYEQRSRELRQIFLEKGVKFYDKDGWGYIKNGIKTYIEKTWATFQTVLATDQVPQNSCYS